MEPLRDQPTGLVAGPSNMGVGVLRYTRQRAWLRRITATPQA